eukprot:SAG31_NODE_41356_length_276_cov_0.881356_1_plen_49_part_01
MVETVSDLLFVLDGANWSGGQAFPSPCSRTLGLPTWVGKPIAQLEILLA